MSTPTRTSAFAQRLAHQLGSSPTAATLTDRAIDRVAFAHDASHYLLQPQAVITPTDARGVAAVMRACHTLGVPLTFRSGGTSLSGQAQTDGLLVDTRRGFQAVDVLNDGLRVRVQPGVTIRRVNAHLARFGRKLGPDPASEIACTVGGVVANNSSGMQCGTTYNTYRTIVSLELVLPSGTVIDTGAPDALAKLAATEPELLAGLERLGRRIRDNAESVRTIERLFSIKNTMGYGVNSFVDFTDPVEVLTHLMVGSEGTLGFVASATFDTIPVLPAVTTALVVCDDLQRASDCVPELVAAGVATAELLDAASLRVSQADRACPAVIRDLTVDHHAAVLIELQAANAEELADLQASASPVLNALATSTPITFTSAASERAALWHARKGLYSAVVAARPSGTNALLEDIAVPVDRLGELCRSLTALFDQHHYEESVIFGHARDGNLHFLLNERFDDPVKMARYEAFTDDMVALVLGLDGTLKAEHGTGRIMAPFVRAQYGDELYAVMREIKELFDPAGIVNPGSVLSDDPRSYLADLKTAPTIDPEVDRCVECGFCEPVCPSRTLTLTPRQRIVVRREREAAIARSDTATAQALSDDFDYDGVQTCAADGMCATACPVYIDTGALVRRLRAEDANGSVASKGWSTAARAWGPVSRGAGLALTVAATIPGATTAAKLARNLFGDDLVPAYDAALPRGGSPRVQVASAAPQAVLFASCLGTMFDSAGVGSGPALVRLAERAGVGLVTPDGLSGLCCGTPWKSKGHLAGWETMRRQVQQSVRAASRQGTLPVIVDASSCTEGLSQLLAEESDLRVLDAVQFVADELLEHLTINRRWDSMALHPTCSSTALGSTAALEVIARAIADEVAIPVAWGCCGFAGDRGMLHPELTAAATAAEAAEVTEREYSAYASSNRTCEIGLQRATQRPYRHILELLEEATR